MLRREREEFSMMSSDEPIGVILMILHTIYVVPTCTFGVSSQSVFLHTCQISNCIRRGPYPLKCRFLYVRPFDDVIRLSR